MENEWLTNNLDTVRKYSPYIYFDMNEPFLPDRVGYTIFEKDSASPSFDRDIEFYNPSIRCIIEYAIYWDFDIQHLYDLEHVWIYVDQKGEVCECESSFHGSYLRSLLKNRSNIEDGTHVRLYSQPGKHAFLPTSESFDLLPRNLLYTPAWEDAGDGGLLIPSFLKSSLETDERKNGLIRTYLQKLRFIPSMEFVKYVLPAGVFLPWPELLQWIPHSIDNRLKEMNGGAECE